MDAARFDAMTRALHTRASRRGLARILGGSALGVSVGLLGETDVAARKCRKKCGPCERCRRRKCVPKEEMSSCGTGQVCRGGACVSCWNGDNSNCCQPVPDGVNCYRATICQAGQCVDCDADLQCEGRCLSALCRSHCYKSCLSNADCCSELTCQLMPEQGDPNKMRCAPA
jgi:hypothetical protein